MLSILHYIMPLFSYKLKKMKFHFKNIVAKKFLKEHLRFEVKNVYTLFLTINLCVEFAYKNATSFC